MSELILLRHAKSEEPYLADSDFERHLKKRGREDIKKVAGQFARLGVEPGIILCSTSNRTRETLKEFLEVCPLKAQVRFADGLYHASASEILDFILKEQDGKGIMVVGHNMGLSRLAEILTSGACGELPTSGLALISFDAQAEPGKGKLLRLITADKD